MPVDIFSSLTVGDLIYDNRIAMAPMTRARSGKDRMPNALMAQYYRQRASAGLIITEATAISEQALGWNQSPGIYSDAQMRAWQQVTDAVHTQGGKIFLQFWHCGRASHTDFHPQLGLPVAPSPVKLNGEYIHTPQGKKAYETPRALEEDEIGQIVEDYRRAAARARDAGFDGVEIHAANGYLIDQFLQSRTNQRTDQYGGSLANRFRFLQGIVEAVLEIWQPQRVSVRLSPNGVFNDMGSPDFRESFLYVAERLDTYGLGFLHVMDGLAFGFHELGTPLTLADFRRCYHGMLMGNCGYTLEQAQRAIVSGDADMIAFGRPFISNPDLVERFRQGWPLAAEADQSVWYSYDETGYADFPMYTDSK